MQKLLHTAGIKVLALIEQNIRQGIDSEGQPFAYSEKPFWMPYSQKIVARLGGKKGKGVFYEVTRSGTTGKLGLIILGGYKAFKQKAYPSAANHFLTVTGKMLRSMNVKANDNEAIISFTGDENVKKAYWLNVSGAGRGRKLWKFLGITEQQKQELTRELTPICREIYIEALAKVVKK